MQGMSGWSNEVIALSRIFVVNTCTSWVDLLHSNFQGTGGDELWTSEQ